MAERKISTFSGINNKAAAESLDDGWTSPDREVAPAEMTAAVNVDITDRNRLRTRKGTTLRVAGTPTSLWSDEDIALFVESGDLKRLWPDLTVTTLRSGIGDNVCYVRVDDRVYWSDRTVTGVLDEGVNRSWGLTVPYPQSISVGLSGSLLVGGYLVSLTGIRSNGLESGAGMPARIHVSSDNSSINISWDNQVFDPEITSINIYISNRDGETLYLAGSVPVGSNSFSYHGDKLSTPLNLEWLEKPPACQELTYHKGRIFLACDEFIYATNVHGYEHVDLRDFLYIDGSRITMLESLGESIFVGTDTGVRFLQGDVFKDMTISTVSNASVIAGTSVVDDGFEVFGRVELSGKAVVLFTTPDGVMAGLPDGSIVNFTSEKYDVSTKTKGAAVFKSESDSHQYIVVQQ